MSQLRELSLFSGAGGGLLGTLLLGWRPVGYVEINSYCQQVIAARIKDGVLPEAPIFGDIRAFIHEGYAKAYQGMVDVITAGFPCQPFSTAGKQLGALDERNMWPATIECLRVVRPKYALLENVPALLTSGYFGTILADLAQSGYDARWRILSAAEVGAPHQRNRLWIVAHAQELKKREQANKTNALSNFWQARNESFDGSTDVAHATQQYRSINGQKTHESGWRSEIVADASSESGRLFVQFGEDHIEVVGRSQDVSDTDKHEHKGSPFEDRRTLTDIILSDSEYDEVLYDQQHDIENANSGGAGWWSVEPGLGRVANGVAHRVDRLEAIGNGQVPAVVRAAWELLAGEL